MRFSVWVGALGVLAVSASVAQAGTLKPGLWRFTMNMNNNGAAMPQIPPEALARMKAAGMAMPPGMSMGGGGMTMQHCITPAQAAQDTPPVTRPESGCTPANVNRSGSRISFDLVCNGEMQGSGKMTMSVAPEHFSGDYQFTGSDHGRPMNMQSHIEAQYLSADCGGG